MIFRHKRVLSIVAMIEMVFMLSSSFAGCSKKETTDSMDPVNEDESSIIEKFSKDTEEIKCDAAKKVEELGAEIDGYDFAYYRAIRKYISFEEWVVIHGMCKKGNSLPAYFISPERDRIVAYRQTEDGDAYLYYLNRQDDGSWTCDLMKEMASKSKKDI